MNNIACTSNIQLGNNFTASFSGDNPFRVTTPSALPVALKNSFNFSDVAGVAVAEMAFPSPATSVSPGLWEAVTTGGNTVRFAYSGSTPPLAIAAGTAFTTPDATPDFSKLAKMDLNVGNGALKFSNVALDGGNPYTVTASPAAVAAAKKANATGETQTFNGIEFNPGITIGNDGTFGGDVGAKINFGGAQIGATVGANGVSNLSVGDLSKTLCPNLTEQDKAGGKVCGAANAAISGLVGCAFGGNAGECAKDVGKQLLGGISSQALGGALKGGSSSSGLQVQAAEQALLAQNFLPPNNNTAESIANLTADRNAALAYAVTSYIANAKLWQIKFPQIKADCDKAVEKATKNGDSNSLQAGKIIQIKCYNGMDVAFKNLELERSIVDMYGLIVTAPTAIPPKG
jgi:hypothetical protein